MSVAVQLPRWLEWDSGFWGFDVAEFGPDEIWEHWDATADKLFIQALVDAADTDLIRRATGSGFEIADVRVTLDRPVLRPLPLYDLYKPRIRFYEETDLPHLVRIARESHRITRYYADPGFPDERCHDLYETWIRNSVEGWADRVLVVGAPAHGYCTVHLDGGTASIGLIAVDEAARGQGAGYRLVHGALRWAHAAGAQRMTVVTQGRNIAAQRLFQRCGFRTCDTQVWLHRWMR